MYRHANVKQGQPAICLDRLKKLRSSGARMPQGTSLRPPLRPYRPSLAELQNGGDGEL